MTRFLTEERRNKDDAIQNILFANHPAFRRFAEPTNTRYRVFSTNNRELDTWLKARGWKPFSEESLDDDSVREWMHSEKEEHLKLTHKIFDEDGRLDVYTKDDWNDDWVVLSTFEDIPF